MTSIVISALLVSSIIYLYIGLIIGKHNKSLGDLFPIVFSKHAKVQTADEFSTSTVATTVSLATIILAYFELAGYFGLWLLWTALTTSIGMVLVNFSSKQIWSKMNSYSYRPSMHEFIGVEFNSKKVALVASACTSLGFLLIFATELVVGSKFLAALVPSIPPLATTIFLSLVGFIYTFFGGFRSVVKTDQIQMKFIWALIVALVGYYVYYALTNGGFNYNLAKIPDGILDLSSKPGLGAFLFGIAVMNIPTHISNMAVWQRISGTQDPGILKAGIKKSTWGVALSWSMLALLACFAYMIVVPTTNQTLLSDLLISIGRTTSGKIILFVVVVGLYGAMLSTASTNLIVIAHTISEDIVSKFRKSTLQDRLQSKKEFLLSRYILTGAAVTAVFLVEGLKYLGFSIADLVFSIYGGALTLFPLIIAALYSNRNRLAKLSLFANIAVITGFFSGWGIAVYGKLINNGNMIFLSPCLSIFVSGLVIGTGFLMTLERPNSN